MATYTIRSHNRTETAATLGDAKAIAKKRAQAFARAHGGRAVWSGPSSWSTDDDVRSHGGYAIVDSNGNDVAEGAAVIDTKAERNPTMARAKKNPKAKKNPSEGWDVFLRGKKIDTVFYSGKNTADDIKRSLVSHDGYDSGITVRKSKMKANPVQPITTADGIITDATVLFLGPRHAVTADDELGGYAVLVRDDKDQDDWNAWRWLKTVPTLEQATDPDAPYTAGAENNPSGRSLERYSPAELRNMSSISSGHTDDLKAEEKLGGVPTRFWLSRMTVADGETHAVHVEQLVDGYWQVVHDYGTPRRR